MIAVGTSQFSADEITVANPEEPDDSTPQGPGEIADFEIQYYDADIQT